MPIALVRHLRTTAPPGLCYGRLDLPPHPDTAADAARIAAALARFAGAPVWTSPSIRCRVLAEQLAAPARPRPDPRLRELDFGAWEGLAWDVVPRAALDAWAASPGTVAPPGGETGAALIARVRAVAEALAGGADAVVVSHGGPLKLLAAMLRGQAPDLLAPAPALGSITLLFA